MAGLSLPVGARARVEAVLARCLPDSLFGRLAVLLVVAVISSHVLALTLLFEMRPPFPPGMQAAMPPGAGPGLPPLMAPPGGPPRGPPPAGLLLDIGVRLSALLIAAWIGARWLSDPVQRLAAAARDLGHNIHRPPLPETGTRECREATRVFNQMQQRIRAQLEERDQFVAAVSHDLRTPLTRIALRAESLSAAADRQRFAKDVAEMDTMIRVTLDYLCGAADAEPWVMLDVASLAQSLVHDEQDCGLAVQAEPMPAVPPVRAQATALRRCIRNLIDNALRYGGGARLQVVCAGSAVHVVVHDDGPGIPEAELAKVLQPFYRVEGSRNRHTGGVGLGLAAAHDTARRHGGSLHLRNRPEGGLEAVLALPLA
jgi:signal transduction histidine kinase